jgi:hypothetical protein
MKKIDKAKEIPYTDLTSRAAPEEGMFRVVAQHRENRKAWIIGTYKIYKEAYDAAKSAAGEDGVSSFIHNTYGRILDTVKD